MFDPKTALPHNLPLFRALAPSFSVESTAAPVQGATEIESALTEFTREPGGGLIVMQDIFTMVNRELIIAAVNRHLAPAVYPLRPFAASGGLISYGVDQTENFRGAASYVDRILKGENQPICRCSGRRSLSWLSISKPRRDSVLPFHPRCLLAPTR
jgi:putative tryptophan/tyrosine transport system substrate-binding protein